MARGPNPERILRKELNLSRQDYPFSSHWNRAAPIATPIDIKITIFTIHG
jgi:hypothetical protein